MALSPGQMPIIIDEEINTSVSRLSHRAKSKHKKEKKENVLKTINDNNKKHVHFKDEVEGNNLCDIVIIESYK